MKIKRIFTLAILFSSSLAGQCFASESEYDFTDTEKKFYIGGSVSALGVPYYGDKTVRNNIVGSFIGGYNYTENIKAELEVMLGSALEDVYNANLLANVHYSHKIKDSPLAPYFGIGIGVVAQWGKAFDAAIVAARTADTPIELVARNLLANQIKIGAEYQVTPDISISGGYRFIARTSFYKDSFGVETGIGIGWTSYGLEVGVSYNF